jgi:type II secretory pathway component HofQ
MDERLQRALEQANYNITLQTQKKNHQLRFQNATAYAAHGGSFSITQQLIAFVDALIRNKQKDSIIIDDRGNPILVPDLKVFLAEIIAIYQEAANELHLSMEKLRKARTTKLAAGL